MYIPIAIVCADTLVQSWHRMTDVLAARWLRWANWFWTAVWLVLAAVAFVLPRLLVHNPEAHYLAIPLAGALAITGVVSFISWQRPAWPFLVALGWGAAVLFLTMLLLPVVQELAVSKDAMSWAKQAEDRGYVVGAVGYDEPTLVWYYHKPRSVLPLWDGGPEQVVKLERVFAPGQKQAFDETHPRQPFGTADAATVARWLVLQEEAKAGFRYMASAWQALPAVDGAHALARQALIAGQMGAACWQLAHSTAAGVAQGPLSGIMGTDRKLSGRSLPVALLKMYAMLEMADA